MKKIIVIGSPGASKSTYSRKLHKSTDIPLYYLDMIWHRADISEDFRNEILTYHTEQLPITYELLNQYADGREIVVFKSHQEADDYIESILT